MTTVLPQSIEAEQALLGTIIVYPSAMSTCFENGLVSDDFFARGNQQIYQCLLDLYNDEKPTDFNSLLTRLNDQQLLTSVGGVDYLSQLTDAVVAGQSAKHYIDLVQEKSLLRKLIAAAQSIIQESFANSYESDEVLDKAEKLILDITHSRKTDYFMSIREVVDGVITNINLLKNRKGDATGVKSGFQQLDRKTLGFQSGDLIILAARPAVGKTAFALNLATNAAEISNRPVAVFSLEMPANSLVQRILATRSLVDGSKLRSGFLNSEEMIRLAETADILKKLPIFIDDSSMIKVSEIFAKCRKLKHDNDVGLIIIDYLQLIKGSKNKVESRQVEVAEISRSLKSLARELNVPVIALSQLSRLTEKSKQRPQLSDLRESGSIEQDADIVMFLYHDKKDSESEDEESNVENRDLIIAKHRNGPTGDIKFSFDKNHSRFYELVEESGGS